jgi:hypothetical protein
LSISSWLWYHPSAKEYKDPNLKSLDDLTHPTFKIEFLESFGKGWGGFRADNIPDKYSELNRTVEINNTEKNVSKKDIIKLNW